MIKTRQEQENGEALFKYQKKSDTYGIGKTQELFILLCINFTSTPTVLFCQIKESNSLILFLGKGSDKKFKTIL